MRRAELPGWSWPVLWVALSCLTGCGDEPPLLPKACVASQGGGARTADRYEPNDNLAMATPPAPHTADCAMTGRAAAISGASDVDVFRTGVCDVTEDDQPTAELMTDDPDLRLCLILACDVGTTTVFSCGGGADDSADPRVVAARTEGGFRGCCRTGAGKVSARVQCSGFPLRGHAVQGFLWIDSNAGGDGADHDYRVGYQMH